MTGEPTEREWLIRLSESEVKRLVMLTEMNLRDTPRGVEATSAVPDPLADRLRAALDDPDPDPASTEHPERRRWKIWVCPKCRRYTTDWKNGIECDCDIYEWDEVTVEEVPSGEVQGLVDRLERLVKAVGNHTRNVSDELYAAWQASRIELAKWETASSGEAKDA